MMKIIVALAVMSLAAFAPSKGHAVTPTATIETAKTSNVIEVGRKKAGRKFRGRGSYNRGRFRGRGFNRGRYRRAPRGWRRYGSRPRGWRGRGCIVIGPLWYCP